MNWKGWNWLNEGIYPLALAMLRVCPLWLWLALIQGWLFASHPETRLPIWLMAGLLLGSVVITRWSLRGTKRLSQAQFIVTGLGLVVLLLLSWWLFYRIQYALWDLRWLRGWNQEITFGVDDSPPSYLVMPVIIYLWLRGIIDGSRLLERKDLVSAFALGSISLVLWLLATGLDNREVPKETGVLVLLFFATAMVGLAFSSLETGYATIIGQERLQLGLNRYWLTSVFTIIATLLGVGLLLGALIVPETIAQLLGWSWSVISQMLIFFIIVLTLILYPLFYLLTVILQPLFERIFSGYKLSSPGTPEPLSEGSSDLFTEIGKTVGNLPEELGWVGLLFFILGVGLLFMLALQALLAAQRRAGVEEKRDFIFSKELLSKQLSRFWPQGLNRSSDHSFLALSGEADSRQVIRKLYQELLAATRERDLARLRHQTPTEYEHRLGSALPGSQEALETVTASYVQARYGSKVPTQEQVVQARQASAQFQTSLENNINPLTPPPPKD